MALTEAKVRCTQVRRTWLPNPHSGALLAMEWQWAWE